MNSPIPVVSLHCLKPQADIPDSLIRTVHEALRDVGFLYIKDHGVPQELIQKLVRFSRSFFAESQTFKNQIAMEKGKSAWRGYFPLGAELTSGIPDQKEGIYFGKELPVPQPPIPLHGPNLWPSEARYEGFKPTVLSYMEHLTELGQSLLDVIALGLGLQKEYFRSRFTDNPTTLFRIFHYPAFRSQRGSDWGVREHTDMGFLTILWQDPVGGLQIKKRDNKWIDAPPQENTFIVNIGDMLELWTGGIYRATPHRVKNISQTHRLALPFFLDPNWNSTLEPIPPALIASRRDPRITLTPQNRWDGLELSSISSQTTYGEFVWNKVKKVFPQLAKEDFG